MFSRKIEEYIKAYPNQEYGKNIIRNQNIYKKKKGTYGLLGNIPENGCGSVAYHNILCIMGKAIPYEETLKYIRSHWLTTTFLGGVGGTHIFCVLKMLRNQGLRTKLFVRKKSVPDNFKAYLIFYRYKDLFHGHFQAGQFLDINGERKLVVYNGYSTTDDFVSFARRRKAYVTLVWGIY